MREFRAWLNGWATTLHIFFFERETWKHLTGPLDAADFIEVDSPAEVLSAGARKALSDWYDLLTAGPVANREARIEDAGEQLADFVHLFLGEHWDDDKEGWVS